MRLPICVALAGTVWKTALIVGVRTTGQHLFFVLSTVLDPPSAWLADQGVRAFFDQRRIGPTAGEALLFEVLLVLGFAVQCFVLGLGVQAILRLRSPGPPQSDRVNILSNSKL